MASQHTNALALEGVPNITGPVVVPTEKDTSGQGEADRGDAAENVVVDVRVELAVGTNVEQSARGIV